MKRTNWRPNISTLRLKFCQFNLSRHTKSETVFFCFLYPEDKPFVYLIGVIKNETLFYSWLKEFLRGPGIIYGKDVRMANDSTGSHLQITVRLETNLGTYNACYESV